MSEILMVVCLALMGIYFFKSTDLPKDLKKKSEQLRLSHEVQKNQSHEVRIPKVNFQKIVTTEEKAKALNTLKEQKERDNIVRLEILNQEIDELTLKITTLEQELKSNNARNEEIQTKINQYLERLIYLEKNKMA